MRYKDVQKGTNNVVSVLFIMILYLTIIQQLPIIRESLYENIRYFLYISLGCLTLISLYSAKNLINIRLILMFILTSMYSLVLFIIIHFFGVGTVNVFEILIPLGFILISLNMQLSKKTLNKIVYSYILLSLILGISLIFYYGNGFEITQVYFFQNKNQVGPILGLTAVILMVSIFNKKTILENLSLNYKVVLFGIMILNILTLRNRSSIIAIVAILIILFLKKDYEFTNKKIIKFLLYSAAVSFILISSNILPNILTYINDSIFLNYNLNDLNSISAGRMETYKKSLIYINENLFMGSMDNKTNLTSVPHNYLLNKLVNYGILGSFPYIILYLYLWKITLYNVIFRKLADIDISIFVLLFSLIISVFEYSYPYGPGVSQILLWFLLGQSMLNFKYS